MTPINRLPKWFQQEMPDAAVIKKAQILDELNLHSVCQEARCPNLNRCFKDSRVTLMILGDTCTRNCRFCGVNKSSDERKPGHDLDEPYRIKEAVERLGFNYVVITSVSRDDLADGGAAIFAKCIELIRGINKNIKIEALIPDFQGSISSLKCIAGASPDVVAHNIETIPRLYGDLRPMADYQLSLNVLSSIKRLSLQLITKSSLMLGLGETEEEVVEVMQDLRDNQCDILTLGQYLAPSKGHYPVKEFINLEQFQEYQRIGLSLGFKSVLSGPLVRSSYQAEEVYREIAYV